MWKKTMPTFRQGRYSSFQGIGEALDKWYVIYEEGNEGAVL